MSTFQDRVGKATKTYGHSFDAHLAPWFKSRFGLTIKQNDNYEFDCWLGDYDLDIDCASDRTVFRAASTYAAFFDGPLSDTLTEIEMGA